MIKSLPTTEHLESTNKAKDCLYFITRSYKNRLFYLYKELSNNSLEKIDKGRDTPFEFDLIIWGKSIHDNKKNTI